jgi:hypothetical protein
MDVTILESGSHNHSSAIQDPGCAPIRDLATFSHGGDFLIAHNDDTIRNRGKIWSRVDLGAAENQRSRFRGTILQPHGLAAQENGEGYSQNDRSVSELVRSFHWPLDRNRNKMKRLSSGLQAFDEVAKGATISARDWVATGLNGSYDRTEVSTPGLIPAFQILANSARY